LVDAVLLDFLRFLRDVSACMLSRHGGAEDRSIPSRPCKHVETVPMPHNPVSYSLVMPSNLIAPRSVSSRSSAYPSARHNLILATLPSRLDIPSTVLITPIHGLAFVSFGRRTRSLGSGGSFGAVAALASDCGVPLPATIVLMVVQISSPRRYNITVTAYNYME